MARFVAITRDRRLKGRRGNPNPLPPNATHHARQRNLSTVIQGVGRRISSTQTHVRHAAELARDVGCSYAFSRLAAVQAKLTELVRECDLASREVWS